MAHCYRDPSISVSGEYAKTVVVDSSIQDLKETHRGNALLADIYASTHEILVLIAYAQTPIMTYPAMLTV